MSEIRDYFGFYLNQTPALLWMLILAVSLACDFFINRRFRQQIGNKMRNVLNGLAICAVVAFMAPAISTTAELLRKPIPNGVISLPFQNGPAWASAAAVLAYLLVADFLYYWWHRAQHRFSTLWKWHSIHHSDHDVNATTYVRQHWSEIPLQAFVVNLPLLVIFGPSPPPLLGVLLFTAWSFFVHADLAIGAGRWSRFVTTPALHRVHHSIAAEHHDKNFASYFPVWDMLFGTFRAAKPGEHPQTGLTERVTGLQMYLLR